jgi:hypothetical protein
MLSPERIVEIVASGQLSDVEIVDARPPNWTFEDSRSVGLPVVIGHTTTGFVGAIQWEGDPVTAWFGDTRATYDEARQDVFVEAARLKANPTGDDSLKVP